MRVRRVHGDPAPGRARREVVPGQDVGGQGRLGRREAEQVLQHPRVRQRGGGGVDRAASLAQVIVCSSSTRITPSIRPAMICLSSCLSTPAVAVVQLPRLMRPGLDRRRTGLFPCAQSDCWYILLRTVMDCRGTGAYSLGCGRPVPRLRDRDAATAIGQQAASLGAPKPPAATASDASCSSRSSKPQTDRTAATRPIFSWGPIARNTITRRARNTDHRFLARAGRFHRLRRTARAA